MLTNFNLFLKEIKRLNVIAEDFYFVPNVGKVNVKEAPKELDISFQKVHLLEVIPTDENYLRELQSDAINEIILLNKDQLQNCLNRLKSFDTFSSFYKFWGKFYVKFFNNEFDNRDLFDLKMTLEGYFSIIYPDNAKVDFINDLQDEFVLKHGFLDGLIYQIEEMQKPDNLKENHINEINDLDFYLRNDFNVLIFKELEQVLNPFEENVYPLGIMPLEFFQLLYKKYDEAKLYFNKYLSFETWVNQNIHSISIEYNSKISNYLFDKLCDLLKINVDCNQLSQSTYDNVVSVVRDSFPYSKVSDNNSLLNCPHLQSDSLDLSKCPKYTAKYYAIFHYLRSLNDEEFRLLYNNEGCLKATELQNQLSELYPPINSQSIYRSIKIIVSHSTNLHGFIKTSLAGERTWKSKIREIASFFNDKKVNDELDSY